MSAQDQQAEAALVSSIPFGGSLREDVAPEQVPPGDFLELRNIHGTPNGTTYMRSGFAAEVAPARAAKKILPYRDGYVYVDEFGVLYTYNATLGEKATYGQCSNAMGLRRQLVESSNASAGNSTVVEYSGNRYYFWATQYGTESSVWVMAVDAVGEQALPPTEIVYDGTDPFALCAVALAGTGPYCVVAYGYLGTGVNGSDVFRRRLHLGTLAIDAVHAINILGQYCCYDLAPLVGSTTEVVETYCTTYGAGTLTLKTSVLDGTSASLPVSGTKTSTDVVLSNFIAGPYAIGVYGEAGKKIWVAVGYDDSVTHATVFTSTYPDSNTFTFGGTTTIDTDNGGAGDRWARNISIAYDDPTGALTSIAWSFWVATTTQQFDRGFKYVTTLGAGGYFTSRIAWGLSLVSKLFTRYDYSSGVQTRRHYALLTKPDGVTGEQTEYLVRLATGNGAATNGADFFPIAVMAPRGAGQVLQAENPRIHTSNVSNCLAAVTGTGDVTARRYYTTGCISVGPTSVDRTGLAEVEFDFEHPGLFKGTELDNAIYIAGGVLCIFDGRRCTESGFIDSPSAIKSIAQTTGGSLTTGGTYVFEQTWEQSHANGDVARSRPSPLATKTLTSSNNKVTFNSELPFLTMRDVPGDRSQSLIASPAYRSEAGGSVLYREWPDAVGPVLNNVLGTTGVTADAIARADTTVAAQSLLYTTGGVVENVCPSALRDVWVYKNRLYGIGDDGNTIWQSKTKEQGEGLAFADEFAFAIPDSDVCTAGAALDDFMVVFKTTRTYAIYGDGPSKTNTNSTLAAPQIVSADIGCTDPRSLARIPTGLMFLSRRGIYLLSRSREVSFIGKRIEQTLANFPVCVSAATVEAKGHVRFVLQNAAATAAVIAIYDYVNDRWATWDLVQANGAGYALVHAAATLADGTYLASVSDNATPRVLRSTELDTSPIARDNGVEFPAYAVTAWLRPVDLMGYHRFQRFGIMSRKLGLGGTKVSFALDYVNAYHANTITKSTAQIAAANDPSPWVFTPPVQKAQAIKLKIEHVLGADNSDSGYWVELIGLTMKAIPKTGLFKNVPSAQKGG